MLTNKDRIYAYYNKEITFDLPIEYKGLSILPIKIENIHMYMRCINILDIKKDISKGLHIIKMNPIQHMIYLLDKDEDKDIYKYMMYNILIMSINELSHFEIGIDESNKDYIKINNTILYNKDFIEFKNIILFRNNPDYDDSYIDPELAAELKEADRLRNSGKESASIEEHILSLVINTSLSIETIREYSVRKFKLLFRMLDKQINYEIYKTASVSGNVEFKKEIPHFLEYEKLDFLEGKAVSYDSIKDKINSK